MDKKKYERPTIVKQHSGFMNKFGNSQISLPRTEIDGVEVKKLVNDFSSPLFVLSEKQIRNNQRNANRIFSARYPTTQFAWSYKTNYLNAVCSIFHQEKSWAEVVSEFEYDKARSLGVEGRYIIYNGPMKSESSLRKAIREKAKIHIDHFDELYRLIELTDELNLTAEVAIRVNMDTGIYPKWDRFGFNYENGDALEALKRILVADKLHLAGLHTHIGTYMMTTQAYRVAVSKLVAIANELKDKHGVVLEYIDTGGGFPSKNTLKGQYLQAEQILPELEEYADAITSELYNLNYDKNEMPTLILETGRAMIDDAGYLLTEVIGNKRLSDGSRALIIDAGVNILFTSFWYNHKILPAQETGEFSERAAIYGPLCMNIDIIRDHINMPNVRKGDHLVIHNVGAYNMTQWMQFITLRPNVVMVMEDGRVELIRNSEELTDITSKEYLPKDLSNFSLS